MFRLSIYTDANSLPNILFIHIHFPHITDTVPSLSPSTNHPTSISYATTLNKLQLWNTVHWYVEIKCQLDATEVFIADLIACSTFFQAPLCPSSGAQEYYTGLLQHPANRTHNPQLHTGPATWKPQHEIPQAATLCNTLELLMMGIVVPETCWASNKICNKNLCCI